MTSHAVSLPTLATAATARALPVQRLAERHALVLADDVASDEVEALAVSLDEHAGWVGASRLQLTPGAELYGPWAISEPGRQALGLPSWAASLMILECQPTRSGRLPHALAGTDPWAGAFPVAQPAGIELVALTYLRAIARRLAGALLLAADAPGPGAPPDSGPTSSVRPVLLEPDPKETVDLTVYAPVWLTPDACQAVLEPVGGTSRLQVVTEPAQPSLASQADLERLERNLGGDVLEAAWRQARERDTGQDQVSQQVLTGYAIDLPVRRQDGTVRHGWGHLEVRVAPADWLPLAVRGQQWAGNGAVTYELVWVPEDPQVRSATSLTRSQRAEREQAGELIEAAAAAVAATTAGLVVDASGFLVNL